MPRRKARVNYKESSESEYMSDQEENDKSLESELLNSEKFSSDNEEKEIEEIKADKDDSNKEPKTKRGSTSKRYNNEDLYKMASLVLKNPTARHTGKVFWSLMMQEFGNTIFQGRNATGLKNRWKKVAQMFPTLKAVEVHKKELAEMLSSDIVRSIDDTITNNTIPGPILNKKISRKHKAVVTKRSAVKKKKVDEVSAPIVEDEPKMIKKSKRFGKGSHHFPKVAKTPAKSVVKKEREEIDFEQVVSEDRIELSSLERDRSLATAANISNGRDLVIVRDIKEDILEVKYIKELTDKEIKEAEEMKSDIKEELNGWKKLIEYISKVKSDQKQSLEDVVLKYQSNDINLGFYKS